MLYNENMNNFAPHTEADVLLYLRLVPAYPFASLDAAALYYVRNWDVLGKMTRLKESSAWPPASRSIDWTTYPRSTRLHQDA